MATLPDNYYVTMKDFQEINLVIKKEISNLRATTINIATTTMKLEKRILDYKAKIIKYKDLYMDRDITVYNNCLTKKENKIRIKKLEAFITQCDKYLEEVKSISSEKFKSNISPDDYSEPREIVALSKSDYLLYQQHKLNNQDEIIENMIGVAIENNQIGKKIADVMSSQIYQIQKIDKDLEAANNKVKKTNKRFEDYIDLSSYCKFYAIIVAQFCIILILLFY